MTSSALPTPKIGLNSYQLWSLLDSDVCFKFRFIEMLTRINEKHGKFIVTYYPNQENQPMYFTAVKDINKSKMHIALCTVLVLLQKYQGDASKALESGQDQLYQEIIIDASHDNIFNMSEAEIMTVMNILINDLV